MTPGTALVIFCLSIACGVLLAYAYELRMRLVVAERRATDAEDSADRWAAAAGERRRALFAAWVREEELQQAIRSRGHLVDSLQRKLGRARRRSAAQHRALKQARDAAWAAPRKESEAA